MIKDEKRHSRELFPSNWNGDSYDGQVSISDAIKRSKNVAAVWLLNEIEWILVFDISISLEFLMIRNKIEN